MKDQSDEARSINSYLDMMRSKVWSIEMNLMHQEEEISIENFQTILLGKNRVDRMLIPIFQDHNNKMKKLTGKKYAAGTLRRFEVALNHIQNF